MHGNDDLELIHIIKHGGDAEAVRRRYLQRHDKDSFTTFSNFMGDILKKQKLTRAKLAVMTGIDQDYLFKLLNGSKHTKERDYLLAICIACHLSLADTQRALTLYGFPVLSDTDPRSSLIIQALLGGLGREVIDGMLGKAGYPVLKVRPDMESAVPEHYGFEVPLDHEAQPERRESHQFDDPEDLDYHISAEHMGTAPFDFMYFGEVEVEDHADGTKRYVSATFSPDGQSVFLVSSKAVAGGEEIEDDQIVEAYESLEKAIASDYAPFFLALDSKTDQKAAEMMRMVDDTQYYRIRVGGGYYGSRACYYGEAYNATQPELREYIQVRIEGNQVTYSASHESYYMQYELQDIYPMMFGEARPQYYYLNVQKLEELPSGMRYFELPFRQLESKIRSSYRLEKPSYLHLDAAIKKVSSVYALQRENWQCLEVELILGKKTRKLCKEKTLFASLVVFRGSKRFMLARGRYFRKEKGNLMVHPDELYATFDTLEEAGSLGFSGIFHFLQSVIDSLFTDGNEYCWKRGDRDPHGFLSLVNA